MRRRVFLRQLATIGLGAGLLWVRRDKIPGLWPLFAESPRPADDIGRLGHEGTHPVHVHLAIRDALAYHRALGPARKQARLRDLQRYWTTKVRALPGIVLNTPDEPARACAIASVGIEGIAPKQLATRLLDEHGIWTVAIAELDVLVAALRSLSQRV